MTVTSEVFPLLSRLTNSAAPRSHGCSEFEKEQGWKFPDTRLQRNGSRSARCPVRMAGEQSIHEANLVNKEKTEGHADQAGSDSQSLIEPRESFVRVSKRQDHRSGDQHHSCNCPDPKHEEIRNCPFRILNCGQDQERDCGRTSEAVDEPHDERPHALIESNLAEMSIEPAQWRLLRRVRVSFGFMFVRMSMNVVAVTMRVRMGRRYSDGWRKCVGNPLERAGQVKNAEENQHQADGEFHGETDARRNNPAGQNNSASHQEDGERVAYSPDCTD